MNKFKRNIMTVDLEDYFCDLDYTVWPSYPTKIIETTRTILNLFNKYKVTATFFTVGYFAERFPELIEEIVKNGHEIGSHSHTHLDIRKSNREIFEDDLKESIRALEKASNEKVLGFRAPFFSIDKERSWAIKIMRKYIKYDSSIFPVRTPLYGIPDAPRNIYRPSEQNFLENDESGDFVELPPSTFHVPLIGNIPIAGGFHLRFLPYFFIKMGIEKINKNNDFAICYIHPKDLDEKMPKIPSYGWHYYYGLKTAKQKFEKLLKDFKFDSVRNTLSL